MEERLNRLLYEIEYLRAYVPMTVKPNGVVLGVDVARELQVQCEGYVSCHNEDGIENTLFGLPVSIDYVHRDVIRLTIEELSF